MKQSLQLKIGQSLTMTPQLQQAIRLLQLSSLELQSEIQQTLDSNPLLETDQAEESGDITIQNQAENDLTATSENPNKEEIDSKEQIQKDTIDNELSIDTQWEDWGYTSTSSSYSRNFDDSSNFEYQGKTDESLQQQIQWQVDMMNLSDVDHAIATILIDSMDERGYINADLNEVVEMLNADEHELTTEIDDEDLKSITYAEVETILHLIQSFEPTGIGARNLQECLLIQLKRMQLDKDTQHLAETIITKEFTNLSSRNYRQIMRALHINDTQLKAALDIIQSLDPRPGNQLSQDTAQYVTPDVFVNKDTNGVWEVTLNQHFSPKLKINDNYASMIKRADNSAENVYLKNNLQDAKWFIKSLQSRNETLLKVASSIVQKQAGFFEYGPEAMKPLVLNDIAQEIDMHESTISRVTSQKYMHTPRGVFELKYFFSSHLETAGGGECSSTAIKAVIKKLIAEENSAKPLSDNKLTALLKEQGIQVARRTVAKYREALSIAPSNERKKLL